MKQLLRDGIERMPAPLPVLVQGTFRYLRYPHVRRRQHAERRIKSRLHQPDLVAQGPFRGMRYLTSAYHSEVLPKLVGTYECEVAPAIETLCCAGCDPIVDIGAAEGYYAVGMAIRNPRARVIAFELNASARYYLRRLADRNGVRERIDVRGRCDLRSLARVLEFSARPAIICDCEGAEDGLLRPDVIDALGRAFVLVETHDGLETADGVLEGITERLEDRFAPTHEVIRIYSRARSRDDLPAASRLSAEDAAEAMNEGRPWAQWLFMTPRRA